MPLVTDFSSTCGNDDRLQDHAPSLLRIQKCCENAPKNKKIVNKQIDKTTSTLWTCDGLARLWDKRQFVYNLSTNCVHFVLVLSSFCPKFVTTKTTKIFVICQVLDKNKTKVRQMTNCLQIVFVLSCFCTKFDKWQIWLLFCCDKF